MRESFHAPEKNKTSDVDPSLRERASEEVGSQNALEDKHCGEVIGQYVLSSRKPPLGSKYVCFVCM
jgi:hypothetical protein